MTNEEIYKYNKKEYYRLHNKYERRGIRIPIGSFVEPTDWAYQNGLFEGRKPKGKFIKIGNCRDGWRINVRKNGNALANPYWAGFWRVKKEIK